MNEGTYYPAVSLYTLPEQQEGATVTFNFGAHKYPLGHACSLLSDLEMSFQRITGKILQKIGVRLRCLWACHSRRQLCRGKELHISEYGWFCAGPDLAFSIPEVEGYPSAQPYSAVQQLMQDEMQDAVNASAGIFPHHMQLARPQVCNCGMLLTTI